MKKSLRPYQFAMFFVLLALFGFAISAQRIWDALPASLSEKTQFLGRSASGGEPRTAKRPSGSEASNTLEPAQAGGSFNITQSVMAGGGDASANGNTRLEGTAGQSAADTSTGGQFSLSSGFWLGGACVAIAITSQPASQTVTVGQPATFLVTVAGTSLSYQWRKNSVNIAGATNSSYTIPSVAAADAGNYDVVVTGACGVITSNAATLTITDTNDLLVLHFDNSLNGESGEVPAQASGTTFALGVSGSAVSLPTGNLLTYQSAGNINALEGTVEFWIKPNWNGSDNIAIDIFSWGLTGGLLIKKDPSTMSFSMNLFNAGGQTEIRALPNINDWQANQWHHLACTWNDSSKKIKVYIDGQLKFQTIFTMSLPAINASTFRIGGFANGGAGNDVGLIDELRISGIERTAQEIAQRYLSSLTITSLTVEPESLHQFPGWFWTPHLTAVTNIGILTVPAAGVSWTSSNAAVAIVDATGRINSLAPGNTTLTVSLPGAQDTLSLLVKAPLFTPEVVMNPPALATPAPNSLYQIPVVVFSFLPTADGINIDPSYDADYYSLNSIPLSEMKSNIDRFDKRVKFMLEEGSRFRGYNNAAAQPALGYKVVAYITVYEPIPPGRVLGMDSGFPLYEFDYHQLFVRFNMQHYIEALGVKEVWIWGGGVAPSFPSYDPSIHRPENFRAGWESNMSSPTGDISNSNRDNSDLPVYNKTYVVYGQNNRRTQAEAVHNHGHQLEAILSHINLRQDGNTTMFWQKFVGQDQSGQFITGRNGWTHMPPNTTQHYDYWNYTAVQSDIQDWRPEGGGQVTSVSAATWDSIPYQWPGGITPPQEVESKWYIFWFQSLAGRGNTIPYNVNKMTNWWTFTGDWDAAISGGLGLYEPGICNYSLSATGQSFSNLGGADSVNVTSGSDCKWIASSNEPWITVAGGKTGNGNGAVNISVAANITSTVRIGTVAIAGQVFTVTQGAVCPVLTISPTDPTLPVGAMNQPYSQSFTQTGGQAPITWSNPGGGLPGGVSLNADTGILSGTPTAMGTFVFVIQATDVNGCIGERQYSLTLNQIQCPAITITPSTIANGFVGSAYSQAFTQVGGAGTITWSVSAGALPNGLSLNSATGVLSGNPIAVGSFAFTVKVTDANICLGTRQYTLTINLASSGLQFYPLPSPVRLLDTRLSATVGCVRNTGPFVNNETRTQPARTACSTIPANATAIIGNITVVPTGPGFLTLFSSDATQPTVANSNFKAGEVTNNFFTVGLGSGDGAFKIFTSLFNGGTNSEVIIDVTGYYAPPGAGGLYYHPLPAPVRLLQTFPGQTGCFQNGSQQLINQNDANANPALDLTVDGRGAGLPSPCNGIPSDAVVLVGNATTVFPQAPFGFGYLTIYPSDATRPTVASSNYGNNDIINGPFAVKLGVDGRFKVYTFSTTHLVIDISGYYSTSANDANGVGLLFNPLPKPMRLLETRPDFPGFPLVGCYRPNAPIPGGVGGVRTQQVWGTCSDQPITIPNAARAIVGNVSVLNPAGAGFGTFFSGNVGTAPTVATTNYPFPVTFGYNRHYYVGLSPTDGTFKILTQFTSNYIVDVSGYFAP